MEAAQMLVFHLNVCVLLGITAIDVRSKVIKFSHNLLLTCYANFKLQSLFQLIVLHTGRKTNLHQICLACKYVVSMSFPQLCTQCKCGDGRICPFLCKFCHRHLCTGCKALRISYLQHICTRQICSFATGQDYGHS